jgi:serine/threonine protein kinase/Tol biopolymer transport system component
MIGQVISQYRIVSEIGRGAMGVVYLAEHIVLGRRVAIKTTNSNHGRFLREARAASALSHPHIAMIHDYGKTDDGQPYIVMEYIEGKTLADLIREHSLPIPKSLRIIREVAEALAEAHRHGIIHRDIKPSNIAVDDRGIVKVLDFGLAKHIGLEAGEPDDEGNSLDTRTREGVLVGTPMYFSPEQALGVKLDARSDLFSLGLVLYECLTGEPAFVGATPMEICAKVIRDQPVPPSQINSAVSVDIERVTLRTLEKSADQRYQSASELAADLETLEFSLSSSRSLRLSIDDTQLLRTPETGVVNHRRRTKLLALIVGVLLVGSLSAWWFFRPKQNPPAQVEQVRLGIGGNVIEAAISLDGKYVAYVNDEGGRQSIWLRQIATGTDLPAVNPANTKYKGLSFFPDGNYLSYLKTEGDSADLYQVSTFGGASRRLATRVDTPVSFSPEGKQITFVRYSADANSTTLIVADANGSNERALATLKEPQLFSRGGFYSSGPAWSPDGKTIAVPAYSVTDETYREIILVNAADGRMNPINEGRWNIIEKLVWLADGSGFLMNAAEANSSLLQIWLVNRQGGAAQRITKDPSHYAGLSATKDSRTVLTIKNERISSVWIHADASDSPQQLSSSRYLGTMGISWTADSKLVLASDINGPYEIWTMEADGSNRKQVTFTERTNLEPTVSPDGRYIVYASFEGRHPHLWRINTDGTDARQLTNGGDEDLPRFTPDGKWVVYHSIDRTRYSIRKVSIDGGEPITLVSDEATQPDVSPDGTRVACFARRAGATAWEIFVVPIEGGPPVATFPLPPTVQPEWPGLHWMPDGTGLTYVSTVQGVSNVWRQALSGGDAKPWTDFKENRIFFFDWSRNDRKLVLVRGNETRDLILVRNFLNADNAAF